MRPRWRYVLIAVLGLSAIPLVSLAIFDATWFYPRLTVLRSKVRAASPEEQEPNPQLGNLIDAIAESALDYIVAREISIQPGPEPSKLSQGQWNRYALASTILVRFHCTKIEQRSIYASLAYVGRYGRGLQSAAEGIYSRKLSQLDNKELATIVAYTAGPSFMDRRPDLLNESAHVLLRKAEK